MRQSGNARHHKCTEVRASCSARRSSNSDLSSSQVDREVCTRASYVALVVACARADSQALPGRVPGKATHAHAQTAKQALQARALHGQILQ